MRWCYLRQYTGICWADNRSPGVQTPQRCGAALNTNNIGYQSYSKVYELDQSVVRPLL